MANAQPQPRIVAEGLKFPEGPVALPDGRVLVVEVAGGTLASVSPNGVVEIVAQLGGGPNGAAIGPDGRAYVCNNGGMEFTSANGQLWPRLMAPHDGGGWIDAVDLQTGAVERLFEKHPDHALRAPNDLVFDAEGGFWFTDFGKTFKGALQRDRGAVYYATIDGRTLVRSVFPMEGPNGIGLSPDGRTLYVAESTTARVWAFDIEAPGRVRKAPGGWHPGHMLWAPDCYAALDSLAVDAAGNICVADAPAGRIVVISPQGKKIEQYDMPDPLTTNVCFGGPDLRRAFVTLSATGRLAEIPWPRPGLALPWLDAARAASR